MNLNTLLTIAVAASALSLAGCNKPEPHAGSGASQDVQVHEIGEAPDNGETPAVEETGETVTTETRTTSSPI